MFNSRYEIFYWVFLLNWLVALTSFILNWTFIWSFVNILMIVVLLLSVVFGKEICSSSNWLGPTISNLYSTLLPSRVVSEAHVPNWNWIVWLFTRVDVSILQWDISPHVVVIVWKNKKKTGLFPLFSPTTSNFLWYVQSFEMSFVVSFSNTDFNRWMIFSILLRQNLVHQDQHS